MSAVLVESQAQNAVEVGTRTQLARIADEELSHAAFSWAPHDWLVSQLDSSERRALGVSGRARLERTLQAPVQPVPESVGRELGLPGIELVRAQANTLAQDLWRPALAALG